MKYNRVSTIQQTLTFHYGIIKIQELRKSKGISSSLTFQYGIIKTGFNKVTISRMEKLTFHYGIIKTQTYIPKRCLQYY